MYVEAIFDISEEQGNGYSVVSVTGEIDVATAPALRSRLEGTIDADGTELVIVDLLGVTFIDSTALSVLIEASKRSAGAGRSMRVVVAEPRILRIFEITGLTELFAIRPTRAEAVEA